MMSTTVDDINDQPTVTRNEVDAHGMVFVSGPSRIDEGVADNDVTPGALLVAGATGEEYVDEAGSVDANVIAYALENDWRKVDPEGAAADDTPYYNDFSADEHVPYNKATDSEFKGMLAAGENVAKGDDLVPASGGELQAYDASAVDHNPDDIVAQAQEDLDNSGATETARLHAKFQP